MGHEAYDREDDIKVGSEKGFGIVFAIVFVIIGLWPLIGDGGIRLWALITAAVFLGAGYFVPVLLRPLNILWFKFGMLLHKIMNPLIMGLLFFLTVTPIALLMRMFRKDPLALKFDDSATTYWIERDPPGPTPESMKNQF